MIFEEEWMQNMDITTTTTTNTGFSLPLKWRSLFGECWYRCRHRELGAFEPQSTIYISWLFVVSLVFIYNSFSIFLRSVFPIENHNNRYIFFIIDYTCDAIYLMDIICFKMRLKFITDGQWMDEPRLIRRHYCRRRRFVYDTLALLPIDILFYLYYGTDWPVLRLTRLFRLIKVGTFWEFFARIDMVTKFPYLIRIIHTLIYKIFLIHLSSCAYYLMSYWEGFGATPWTYNNKGNAYLRCFYFAFRTATSIGGRMPKPINDIERIYMIVSWLMGVFVFALLIGQIRDIVATATQNQTRYKEFMNKAVRYMSNMDLPKYLQKRVRLWLTYTWSQQKTFDETSFLGFLPLKMQTDLALSIHYHTLSRVEIFKNCERTLLRDLVLKFRSVLYLPGDYVCKIGDIGHEMYIVNTGQVCVMDPGDDKKIIATLCEGSVFGEISILGIPGFNKRTANVRSVGYSYLFVLSKSDLMDTLKDYPEYKENLMQRVRKLMKCRETVDEKTKTMDQIDVECVVNMPAPPHLKRPSTPRLVHTVMQMMSSSSATAATSASAPVSARIGQLLSRGSRSSHSSVSMPPLLATNTTTTAAAAAATVAANQFQDNPSIIIDNTVDAIDTTTTTTTTVVDISEVEAIDGIVNNTDFFDDNKSLVDNTLINDIIYDV
ncbi:cyclic nucleotide-gated cation channel beta-3-like [Oppia nitens]|uniref:cyclic nucleotide-gated cation channel beta-3-like n=1 Tax=Oppia nitens TaxID=1686743 RepID=UPI0023DC63B9|nr:cyclic nucleotide-gated cation channel beta-3-like [Oppia nitens]